MRRFLTIFALLLAGVIAPAAVVPTPQPGNATKIFNAFLANYAHEDIEWRTDVRMRASKNETIPNGYQAGRSSLGEFIYRPKLFTELSLEQKRAMVRDARLFAFIVSIRRAADGSGTALPKKEGDFNVSETAKLAMRSILDSLPQGERRPQDVISVIQVSAEQMLGETPVLIYLP